MTTIAWDGKTLAADRLITYGETREGSITKICKRKKDGVLCAVSGNLSIAARFQRWFLAGGKGENPPLKADTDTAAVLLVYPDGRLRVYDRSGWYEKESHIFAEGSGWELALGAMAAGATAEEAVRIAARFDTCTGTEVDTLELGK